MTVNQAAQFLGVSRPLVYELLRKGELPCVLVGKRKRFRPADLRAYLDREAQK